MSLPSGLVAALEASLREMRAGDGEPELKHLSRIVYEVHRALIVDGRQDLAEVTFKVLEPINDVLLGIVPPMFTPKDPRRTMPTWKVNLIVFSVLAVDQAMALTPPENEAAAIRRVLPIVRRRLPDTKVNTIRNWRGELQRKSSRPSLPPGAQIRYDGGLPTEAGDTAEARLNWLLGLLDASIRDRPPHWKGS